MSHSEIVDKVREWLGKDGIEFFQDCKKKYGTVSPVYPEPGDPSPHPPIPHPVHFREGMQVRNFLRKITENAWTAHEYDDRWADIVEESIKEK